MTDGGLDAGWQVVAVDPGTSTGVFWICLGRKELHSLDWRSAIRAAAKAGRLQSVTVRAQDEQTSIDQVLSTAELWRKRGSDLSGHRAPQITDWVIEDFILRERTMARSLLSPVRITEGIERTLHMNGSTATITKYSAADAKTVISDERLRHWDLFGNGSKHERDAFRHLCLRIRELKMEVGNA